MKRIQMMTLAAFFALAGAACDVEVEDTPEAAETTGQQPATTPGDQPATGAAAGGAAASLGVDSLDGGGAYLTDGEGRALYMLEGEPADSSTCYEECAREWPPLLAAGGAPRAGAAPIQGNLIGTIERRDGQRQVTYAGQALYYYHDDQNPGDTSGQDLTDQWGEWYLVTPSGAHLEAEGGGD